MSEFMDVFARASKAMRAVSETAMRRHGLHLGQNRVLALLWERDGMTPGEIAAALEVTTPTIVKMVTRMAASGLLVRRRDDPDNRLVRLYLTDAGRALQQAIEDEMSRIEAGVTAGLTAAELDLLTAALGKVATSARALITGPIDEAG